MDITIKTVPTIDTTQWPNEMAVGYTDGMDAPRARPFVVYEVTKSVFTNSPFSFSIHTAYWLEPGPA